MRSLQPVHIVSCVKCGSEYSPGAIAPGCASHPDAAATDLGWRVGEAAANYSWYSTRERALTDRRCK